METAVVWMGGNQQSSRSGSNVLNSPDLAWVGADILKAVKGPEYPQTFTAELNRVSKSCHLDLTSVVSNKPKFKIGNLLY